MVHQELDSFFWKFKNLLFAEIDATVTFKSEAGKASVSITVDLGHVHSVQGDLPPRSGLRNGPARQRRREKHAAACAEKATAKNDDTEEEVSTEKVENTPATAESPVAEEVNAQEFKSAAKAQECNDASKKTTGKVETSVKDLNDEVCPDEVYENQPRKSFSVGTQTLECGMALQRTSRKSDFDFYTLQYDDSD